MCRAHIHPASFARMVVRVGTIMHAYMLALALTAASLHASERIVSHPGNACRPIAPPHRAAHLHALLRDTHVLRVAGRLERLRRYCAPLADSLLSFSSPLLLPFHLVLSDN